MAHKSLKAANGEIFDLRKKNAELRGRAAVMEEMAVEYKNDWRDALEERDQLQEKYNDLLHQVATKHPDETRHETAKRYIQERENSDDGTADEVQEV